MDGHRSFTFKKGFLYLKMLETTELNISEAISSSSLWRKDCGSGMESLYECVQRVYSVAFWWNPQIFAWFLPTPFHFFFLAYLRDLIHLLPAPHNYYAMFSLPINPPWNRMQVPQLFPYPVARNVSDAFSFFFLSDAFSFLQMFYSRWQ